MHPAYSLCQILANSIVTLQAVLVQLSAKECLVPMDIDKYDSEKLEEVLQRCQVVLTKQKKGKNIPRITSR